MAEQGLGGIVFDKVTSITMGEDVARFMAMLPIIKTIDDRIDKTPAEQWSSAKAKLGDQPSQFLNEMLTDGDKEKIKDFISRYKLNESDVWQGCNLIGLQLSRIKNLSDEVRANEAENPINLDARRELVDEHEKLSIIAMMFAAINPSEVASVVRKSSEKNGETALKETQDALINGRDIKIGLQKFDGSKFGAMMQAVDDANDLLVDLQSEADGRISPNRFIIKNPRGKPRGIKLSFPRRRES